MKYTNIENQEGAFNVTSDNKKVIVNITERHPELVLEDNSMIIFDNIKTYYEMVGTTLVSDATDGSKNIDMKSLFEKECVTDTVSRISYNGADITSITSIKIGSGTVYFVQRNQINKHA